MEKDKVIVEKDSIPHCGWCGTWYSPDWIQLVPDGPRFCTNECMAASRVGMFQNDLIQSRGFLYCTFILAIICGTLLVAYPAAAPIWFGMLFVSICCFCTGAGISKTNKAAREYLYRKDMYRESHQVLLECVFCSHLNPPNILDCQHCDGSLRDSRTTQGEIPEWLMTEAILSQNREKCPHCDAVYGYDNTLEDGTVICQNCRQPFSVSTKS